MAGPLASKVVIVTGGATGIGRAVAGRVVSDGGAVVIGGRRRDTGERAAGQLREGGGRALFVATDVTVEREVERLVATAVAEFGRLDGAVNNAGGVNASGPVHSVDGGEVVRWIPRRLVPGTVTFRGEPAMTFCTLVEFEWDETFGQERFTSAVGKMDGDTPEGLLSRIVGIDDKGARVIEVWRSGDDAQAFAEKSRPFLAAAQMPPPSRVIGFQVTSYLVA